MKALYPKAATIVDRFNALEILNYFDSRKTNALLKGFNSVIGLIDRKSVV